MRKTNSHTHDLQIRKQASNSNKLVPQLQQSLLAVIDALLGADAAPRVSLQDYLA